MLKNLLLTTLSFLTSTALAAGETPCLRLLTQNVSLPEYDSARITTAQGWIAQRVADEEEYADTLTQRADFAAALTQEQVNWSTLSLNQKLNLAARYILSQWDRWKSVSDRERDTALGLELMKLSPKAPSATLTIDGNTTLTRLSARNKVNLLAKLSERYPLPPEAHRSKNLIQLAKKLAADLNFEFARPFEPTVSTGYLPAFPSDREQRRLGLSPSNSFYSKLVGSSATVNFFLTATKIDEPLLFLNGQKPQIVLRLDEKLAEEHGFLIPNFKNVIELTNLFYYWDSKSNERLLRQNWMNLPKEVNTLPKFYVYLDPDAESEIFPEDELYERMSPLREALQQFVLTVPDGKEFLQEAFEHFIIWNGYINGAQDLQSLNRNWNQTGGAQNLFSGEFMKWLGWNGVALRVPTVVTPNQFQVQRIMDVPFKAKGLRETHRLDKSQMP